jgi:hypothetical protein
MCEYGIGKGKARISRAWRRHIYHREKLGRNYIDHWHEFVGEVVFELDEAVSS